MLVPELLLDILEDLKSDEFQLFKWYLSHAILENCKPIPKSHLEDASRANTVNKLMESYREEMAVKISVEILKKMSNNLAAEELRSRYAGVTASRNQN